ncbi:MAG TPA: HAD-IIIC family phosphatase [Bacteroidia bacterium]|nr:HAD-IIIC family phosphatase [Bacteroidia bacterium]
MNFAALKKNLKKDVLHIPPVKVALLGDSSTQLFNHALRGYGINENLNLEIFEADYDQIDQQVMSGSSELYEFNPRFIIIFQSVEKLFAHFCEKNNQHRSQFAADHINSVEGFIDAINGNSRCNIIYLNFAELADNTFGHYANKIDFSFTYQLRKINFELMDLGRKHKNFFIADLSALQNAFGRAYAHSPQIFITTSMVHTIDFLPHVAKSCVDIIKAIQGKIKKCLILDLDNTTWGGIIGDDGMEGIQIGSLGIGEAFTQLQRWVKQLKERGIILAVCSKNTDEVAREPFEKHPDMILRIEDIAVFVANWENKADNIRNIQSVLNIGFDSMVFIDDNPAERKIVRDNLPEVTVPELPEDPAEYVGFLQSLNLFETASVTEEDGDRTKQYQEEAKRASIKKAYTNEADFLQSLSMTCVTREFEKMDIPRIAQLTQRSNQFNLRTIRYTEDDLKRVTASPDQFTLSFKLGDIFGDYGLVSAIIAEKKSDTLFIDTWIMSCRVLKRGLEQYVTNQLVEIASRHGIKKVTGEYIPTPKNGLVKDHYKNLGFVQENNVWVLDVNSFNQFQTHIKEQENGS